MSRVSPSPDNLVTIDLDAVAANYAALAEILPPEQGLAGVVKADAYGHGMVPVARRLKQAGAEALSVAQVDEGALLRRHGITGPILVMMGLGPGQAARAVKHQLTPMLTSLEDFSRLSRAAGELGRTAACQLKVDTGMHRLGVAADQAMPLLLEAAELPGLEINGLVSHLACAGELDHPHARRQTKVYATLLGEARLRGFELPLSSLAGSGGILAPPWGLPGGPGLVRPGITLYGGLPHPSSEGRVELSGAMRFTSRLAAVRPAAAGACVSYGCTWKPPEDTMLGVVAAGYSDGYPRSASNRAEMLINGQSAPVRGRVCMNLTVVELKGFDPLPRVGDEVVLLGRQGESEITIDQLAQWADTIPYEITCSLGAANRRRFSGS